MTDRLDQATEQTTAGALTVTWGVNDWAMVDLRGRSTQRQVNSWHELQDLLVAVGLPADEAETEARSLWHARPKDATGESSRPGEAMWRATGARQWVLAVILVGVLVAFVLAYLIFVQARQR